MKQEIYAMVKEAKQYESFHEAWEDCDNVNEMFRLLEKAKCDRSKLILCLCNIAEHVLHFFEEKYPDDVRPRRAIEAARKVAENETEETLEAALDAARAAEAAKSAVYDDALDATVLAARAAFYVAAYVIFSAIDRTAKDYAFRAAEAAANAVYEVVDGAAATVSYAAERQWQRDCVRRYFPNPFEEKEESHAC